MRNRRLKIWIDLENSPHVLFFAPVIDALRAGGHEVLVTARRFCNTLALARARGIAVLVIGRGHDTGRSVTIKRGLHYLRCLQLWRFAQARRFDVAASHASRTQASTAARLGIPLWAAMDYEHTYLRSLRGVRCFMVPEVMPVGAFDGTGIPRAVIRRYDGIKEDVYLNGFRPTVDPRRRIGVADEEILVTCRPSSDSAHYGSDAGRAVEGHLLERLARQAGVRIVVLPRTVQQQRRWRARANGDGRLQIHAGPVDGPSLIYASDLVVSGGGTMAREAAVLGVPAISCFTGPLGAVDEFLARQQRIRLVRTIEDADRVEPVKRNRRPTPRSNDAPLRQVVETICATADLG